MIPPGRPWRRLQAMTGLRLLYRALRSREGRGYAWLKITSPEPLFQDYGTTSANRYPRLFGFVQESLSGTAAPRLLSFGCSTGRKPQACAGTSRTG